MRPRHRTFRVPSFASPLHPCLGSSRLRLPLPLSAMPSDDVLSADRFPRATKYHPDWILAGVSGGAPCLQLTEWLTQALTLKPGMRVLDLGCGRALSSIFLRREFGVQVWAADLWFDPSENYRRIEDAGVADGVFPIRADARSLPFAADFFDAVVSVDSWIHYGTEDGFLRTLARFVKPGGQIGIAQAGLTCELDDPIPPHLREWWMEDQPWCLHSASWWRRHWERTGILDMAVADSLPEGWRHWLNWLRRMAPGNTTEIQTVEADAGRYLGFVRVVGRRRSGVALPEPILSVPTQYQKAPLLRDSGQASNPGTIAGDSVEWIEGGLPLGVPDEEFRNPAASGDSGRG